MQIIKTIAEIRQVRHSPQGSTGFVPTMGYLHEGHLSLVRHSHQENNSTFVSIFVNPSQFGPNEDFERYPRDFPRDLALLEKEGADFVFIPEASEMYPDGYNTWVEVDGITERLEGSIRPGHFRGVATIVTKLFNIVQPHRAYFGQKDAQQCMVIKKMARELNMNLDIVICPTVREADGLAMSSRNIYLSPEERQQAPVLFQSLNKARDMWAAGERDSGRIRQAMTELIRQNPLGQIEYISIADALNLNELEKAESPVLISMVVKFGRTRLLDNILLE
ncbi:MAG: pantoate--beta-alanine ligase [Dehalococcoidales bacterium]|nr:pantoate--beta-alanine ligase [Dehalococcoidales bacterium]